MAVNVGYEFLHGYVTLAHEAHEALRPNFKIRLRHHGFHHILHSLDCGDTLNPWTTSCWMEEIHVGRQCKTAKGTHPFTCGGRVLQRWLAGLLSRLYRSDE